MCPQNTKKVDSPKKDTERIVPVHKNVNFNLLCDAYLIYSYV